MPYTAALSGKRSTQSSSAASLYGQIDHEINERIGVDTGFESLLASRPCQMDEPTLAGFRSRYALIKSFQLRTLALFKASLNGECDPAIAGSVVGELPAVFGADYHRRLTERQHSTPVFFRTDEAAPGQLTEIQCPGSAWCFVEQLRGLYDANEAIFGAARHFPKPLAAGFAESLRAHLGAEPVVHHLVDNASRPHGMRYFIQRTREHGVRYFSYDRNVTPRDCNFVRSHDYVSLLHHNFFGERMARCDAGEVRFDLSPSALFDCKVIMAWPFWERTRDWYPDEVRSLFPYTSVVEPDGIVLEDGGRCGLDAFCGDPALRRSYFFKYAGSDVALNWGSRAVFRATSSGPHARSLLDEIVADHRRHRYWVLQKAVERKQRTSVFDRDGTLAEVDVHPKWSAFYGPAGLLAIMLFEKQFYKVHGGTDAVMSIVY